MGRGLRVAIIGLDPWEGTGSFQPFDFGARRIQAALIASQLPGLDVFFIEQRVADFDLEAFTRRVTEVEPDLIAASAYVWSFPLLLEIIEKVKQKRPGTVAVMGGPSARISMFDLAPFRERKSAIDALVSGEGEEIIVRLASLPDLSRGALATLPGISLPNAEGWQITGKAEVVSNLDALPSPYAMGLVPRGTSAHLETFRGCPLACSFCEWGMDGDGKRAFSRDYLIRELLAIADLRTSSIAMLTDAALNLNPRAFKSLREAEKETGVIARIGLNFEVYPSHLTEEHLEFITEIQRFRPSRAGLGLQSFDPQVLKDMNRPFDEKRFDKVASRLASTGCQVEIETIVGLPGDSPASFRRTIERARELPCDVRVYPCLALPDGLMTRAPEGSNIDFDPHTLMVRSGAGWTESDLRDTWAWLDSQATEESLSGDHRYGQRRVSLSWVFRNSKQQPDKKHMGAFPELPPLGMPRSSVVPLGRR